MTYRIEDDKGVIATFEDESEAREEFATATSPSGSVGEWEGDLVLVEVLAVRR